MTLELTGDRVRAREWRTDDAAAVWALTQQRPMFGPQGEITSLADAERWVAREGEYQAEPARTRFRFALELPSTSTLIGGCRLHIEDASNKMASIGMSMHPDYQGQGIGFEVARWLLGLAFETLELHRVEALIEPSNLRSLALVKKLGFTHEGRLRKRIFDADWEDSEVFSMLDHEWRAR